jgi:hypothetical protein
MAADLAGTTSTNAMCRERLLRWPYVVFHARDCALVPFHSRRNCASPRATVMGLRARRTWSRHGGILNVFVPGARQYSLIPRRYCRWQGRRGPDDHLPPQHVQTLTPFSSVCGARAHIPEHAPVRRWSSCFPPWNSENLLRGKLGVECTVYDPELFRREILPRLRTVPLAEIMAAAACSKASASDYRRGKRTPHVSTWGALGDEQALLELPASDRLRIDVELGGAGERAPASRTVAQARGAAGRPRPVLS